MKNKLLDNLLDNFDITELEIITFLEKYKKEREEKYKEDNKIELKKQIKEVTEKYSKYQKEKVEINRRPEKLWLINLNFKNIQKEYSFTDKELILFKNKFHFLTQKYGYYFSTSGSFGKHSYLFDNIRSFKIFNSFLHSKHFISEINHSFPNQKISINNQNFKIKVAAIKKGEKVEEILNKLEDSFLFINSFEDNNFDSNILINKINNYLGLLKEKNNTTSNKEIFSIYKKLKDLFIYKKHIKNNNKNKL